MEYKIFKTNFTTCLLVLLLFATLDYVFFTLLIKRARKSALMGVPGRRDLRQSCENLNRSFWANFRCLGGVGDECTGDQSKKKNSFSFFLNEIKKSLKNKGTEEWEERLKSTGIVHFSFNCIRLTGFTCFLGCLFVFFLSTNRYFFLFWNLSHFNYKNQLVGKFSVSYRKHSCVVGFPIIIRSKHVKSSKRRLDVSFDADRNGVVCLVVLAIGVVEGFLLLILILKSAQEWHNVSLIANDTGRWVKRVDFRWRFGVWRVPSWLNWRQKEILRLNRFFRLATWLTQRPRQIGAARDVIKVLTLHLLLIRFEVIKVVEIAHDNRLWKAFGEYPSETSRKTPEATYHRKRNGQHTSDSAQRSHNLAPNSDRGHITVSDCCLYRNMRNFREFVEIEIFQ